MIKIKLDQKTINLIESKIELLDNDLIGVYFLTYNDTVVYVGKSKNIKSRIKSHIQERTKVFSDFYFIKCEKNILDETEVAYIYMHDPIFNKKDSLTDGISTEEFCIQNGINYEHESSIIKNKMLFTATDIANHYKMNVKTAQRWAKAKDWRAKVYKTLEKQMIIDLAEQVKEM